MNIRTIVTWNNALYEKYGHRFQETYNWVFPLTVYNEDVDLFDLVPDCKAFVERNAHRPVRPDKKGFRYDGVRFCYKVYSFTHALLTDTDSDGIICIDADCIFHKPIDANWIRDNIHRDEHMMTYLGRSKYSECGFLYFNMKHPYTKQYAQAMKDIYDTDGIYELKEYHDSYIWDHVRKQFENDYGITNHNIGDNGKGHVHERSVLAPIYTHLKGSKRKYK